MMMIVMMIVLIIGMMIVLIIVMTIVLINIVLVIGMIVVLIIGMHGMMISVISIIIIVVIHNQYMSLTMITSKSKDEDSFLTSFRSNCFTVIGLSSSIHTTRRDTSMTMIIGSNDQLQLL